MKKLPKIIKPICFMLVFAFLLSKFTGVLKAKFTGVTMPSYVADDFLDTGKNGIDVLFLGSSQLANGISSAHIRDKYKVAAFGATTAEQPVLCSYYFLTLANMKNDLKAVVFDTSMLFEKQLDSRYRQALDPMPMSITKAKFLLKYKDAMEARDTAVAPKEGEETDGIETYFLTLLKYHSRWNELTEDDFKYLSKNTTEFFGGSFRPETNLSVDLNRIIIDDDAVDYSIKIDDEALVYFREMLEYCRIENIPMTLIKSPKGTWTRSNYLLVKNIADEYGIEYLDYNLSSLFATTGLDVSTDFANEDHLNTRGALKYSECIMEYLNSKYDIPKRDEELIDAKTRRLYNENVEDCMTIGATTVEEFLDCINNDRYLLYIQLTDDLGELLTDNIKNRISAMRLNKSWDEMDVNYNTPVSVTRMELNGNTYAFNKKGLNILVYDTKNKKHIVSMTLFNNQGVLDVYRNRDK